LKKRLAVGVGEAVSQVLKICGLKQGRLPVVVGEQPPQFLKLGVESWGVFYPEKIRVESRSIYLFGGGGGWKSYLPSCF